MTDSLATNQDDDVDDRLLDEFLRPGSGRLATRVGGYNLIDASEIGHYPTLSPHRKTLLLLLLLCLKDRATELRFEPRDTDSGEPGVRVSYAVNGEIYELMPPPLEIAIEIIQEIKTLAGFLTFPARMREIARAVVDRIASGSTSPTYGGFRIGAQDRVCEVTVMVQPSPRPDRILIKISAVDPALARVAQENLQKLFANRQKTAREEGADAPITA